MSPRQEKNDSPKIKQKRSRPGTKPIVAEGYSRPRVTACVRMHYTFEMIASRAYDTHSVYDFTDEKVIDAAKKEIDQNDTDVVVITPPCTKFSSQHRYNEKKKQGATVSTYFIVAKSLSHLTIVLYPGLIRL